MSLNQRHSIAVCCLLLAAMRITAAEQIPSAAPGSEQARVVETMRSMYSAVTNDDLARFHEVAAPDFYAFDGGKRFTGDALMELIKGAHAAGKVYVWNVTKPEVHIEGNIAWITYVNEGSMRDATGTKNLSWLESAVLRKKDGKWQIQFLHSTRVS